MFDLIIIGSGPAGITAGIYAIRKKLNTLIISESFAGQTAKTFLIENYTGFDEIAGAELAEKFRKHLEKFKANIKEGEEVVEINKKNNIFEVITSNKNSYLAKSVIITSGSKPRLLQVPGEKEFTGRGVSYCTICDAPFYRDKVVAVVGSGNSGLQSALDLAKYAKKVYVLEYLSKVVGDAITFEKVKKNEKIELIFSVSVKEIKGDKFVKSLAYEDLKSKKKKEMPINGAFIQIGYQPEADFAKNLVDFNDKKEIIINPLTNETKTPGLFAAGDVSSVLFKQMIIAAGEGAKATLSCYEYLKKLED
jgi:alkyl hydroperoxide reductase subunit F